MEHDIFFDCPLCHHTIKASADLVGIPVACPDCGNEFKVPEILDGLNPRLRSQTAPEPNTSMPRLRNALDDLQHLDVAMRSLLRRQHQQLKQLNFLEENCSLIHKQLNLLERPISAVGALPAKEVENPSTLAAEMLNVFWGRWSLVCGVLTLLAAVTVGVLLIITQ
jgi:hypothetical protein